MTSSYHSQKWTDRFCWMIASPPHSLLRHEEQHQLKPLASRIVPKKWMNRRGYAGMMATKP
jgi:hypothetical protein